MTTGPTRRYLVTIHDTGNITDDPDNVRTILTSADNIQPRDRVAVAALPDPLAGAAVMLAEYEHGAATPRWEHLRDVMRGRTFELRRGVTFTTPAEGEGSPVYVEAKSGRIYDAETDTSRDGRTQINLTVYGTVTRGDRTTRGSVEVWHATGRPDASGNETRAYWRNLTGADVPEGARKDIAAAVLAELTPELPDAEAWHVLGDEADAASHSADVRRHVSEAVRAIEQAQRTLAGR